MKKVCNKWKVFLIVLCMLFTMTPTAVFADQTDSQQPEEQQLLNDQIPPNNGDPPVEEPPGSDDPPGLEEEFQVQSMSETKCCKGKIKIIKEVTGNPETDEDFTFEIWKNRKLIDTETITGSGSAMVEVDPNSWYTVKEVEIPDDYQADGKKKDVFIGYPCYYAEVTFTNNYTPPPPPTPGSITITKEVAGEGQIPAATFNFLIEGPDEFSTTASISGNGSETIDDLVPGDYLITEEETPGFTPADEDYTKEAEVFAGEATTVAFVNNYNGTIPTTGSITIQKEIGGQEQFRSADQFNFIIGNSGFTTTASIIGEGSYTITGLQPGTYTVTEEAITNYTPRQNGITAEVTAGGISTVTFINDIIQPDPAAWVTKTVAEFDGTNLPSEGSFKKELKLSKLNKKVIYRIELACNTEWSRHERAAALKDVYEQEDITEDLLIFDGTDFLNAKDQDPYSFPDWLWLDYENPSKYYYIDTLTANGTYTNTAYLCSPDRAKTAVDSEEDPEVECNLISSSSAVVIVDYSSGGGGGGGGSHHYYKVIYDPNYPASADTSGTAPVDSNSYSYNNPVNVKGNTGDLAAGTYVFDGWNTEPDGSGTAYPPGYTFNITEDMTLYAQWKLVGEEDAETLTVIEDELPALAQETGLDDVPKTGDATPLIPMLLLGLLSAAALFTFGRRETEVK